MGKPTIRGVEKTSVRMNPVNRLKFEWETIEILG